MSKRIYIDMDGTLCRFHDQEHQYIEKMWEPGFYIGLKPFEEFLNAVSLCIDRNPTTEFYVLSAILDTEPPFAAAEKREWLHRHLPQINDEHMIFTPAGVDKAEYVDNINADCYLIDDYNKNLTEWQQSSGTAIKFINDINNRGLGAYGGEKGPLWDGMSIRYDQSAMTICLELEQLARIERSEEKATAFYGFETDVLPREFLDLLPEYFQLRQANDDKLVTELARNGEQFFDYNSVSEQSRDFVKWFSENVSDHAITDFMQKHGATDTLMECLNKAYTLARSNAIPATKLLGWIESSIKFGKAWSTHPVSPANLQVYIGKMQERDDRLKALFVELDTATAGLKQLERALYLPTKDEVAKNTVTNNGSRTAMQARGVQLREKIEQMKAEWLELAKAPYPEIAFGHGKRKYPQYAQLGGGKAPTRTKHSK